MTTFPVPDTTTDDPVMTQAEIDEAMVEVRAILDAAKAKAAPTTIHPLEQHVLDYLAANPGRTLSDAVYDAPGVVDEDDAIPLVARLLWHRRIPELAERAGYRRTKTLEEATLAARHLLFVDEDPLECGLGAHTPECKSGHDRCGDARDEDALDSGCERLAYATGGRY